MCKMYTDYYFLRTKMKKIKHHYFDQYINIIIEGIKHRLKSNEHNVRTRGLYSQLVCTNLIAYINKYNGTPNDLFVHRHLRKHLHFHHKYNMSVAFHVSTNIHWKLETNIIVHIYVTRSTQGITADHSVKS